MKTHYLIICLLLAIPSQAQNLLFNGDFRMEGGSLTGWGHTENTELVQDGMSTYARLWGENGVLYQKVEGLQSNIPYKVNIYFRFVRVRQTTGYGYAVESGEPLVLPTFTIGATNLRSFCEGNGGEWINLPANLEDNDTVMSFLFTLPENATAAYIALGTKGALSVYEIDSIQLLRPETKEVQFKITERTTGNPVENAEVSIHEVGMPFLTDTNGEVVINLLPREAPYDYSIHRDWYQSLTSSFILDDEGLAINLQLDSIIEVKDVSIRISKYGETLTPYPLFGHMWSSGLHFSDERIEHIASSLDYIIGGAGIPLDSNLVNRFKAIDPRFQVIRYQGGWSTSRNAAENSRMDLQYYRCGVLAQSITATDTVFAINMPPDNRGMGFLASEEGNFVTWIRIDKELMKINAVSSQSQYPITVTVERGYDGTQTSLHTANSTVTAPLYTTPPNPGGNNSGLSYFTNIWDYRTNILTNNAMGLANDHNYDGIWIDILVGWLGATSMTGGNYTNWDYRNNSALSSENIIRYTKDAVQEMYNRFYSRMGYFPVIYGNNVLFSTTYNPGSRGFVMEQTAEHEKVIDGFCHENTWGHMSDSPDNIDNDGEPVSFDGKVIIPGRQGRNLEWYVNQTWVERNVAVALLAQLELPNQPMTINAGFKNQWFAADLTEEVRYAFNKYSYASYLLCVNVSPDSLISTRMGISVMGVVNGQLDAKIDSFFYHQIGVPLEQHPASQFTRYRVGNHNLYARRFSNGLVLVNPFKNDMTVPVTIASITGNDSIYYNPDNNNQTMLTVQLKSTESLILLKSDSDPTDIQEVIVDQSPELNIYPVPARHSVNIQVSVIPNVEGAHEVIIHTTDGLAQSRMVHFEHGNAQLSLTGLKPGLYSLSIPRLNLSGRIMVY
jgi:hypothetical protein